MCMNIQKFTFENLNDGYLNSGVWEMKFIIIFLIPVFCSDFSNLIKWHRGHGFLHKSVEIRNGPFGRGLFAKEKISDGDKLFSVDPEWLLSDENALKIIGVSREKAIEGKLCDCCILSVMPYLEGKSCLCTDIFQK